MSENNIPEPTDSETGPITPPSNPTALPPTIPAPATPPAPGTGYAGHPMHPATPPIGQVAQGSLPGEQPNRSAAAAAGYPTSPGWQQPPLAPPATSEPAGGWQAAYEKANKKSRIFMATTGVAAVLALGLGAWGVAQAASTSSSVSAAGQGLPGATGQGGNGPGGLGTGGGTQGGPGQGLGAPGMGGPGGGPGMGGLASNFFNSDGSVNQAQVDQLKQLLSSGNGPTLAGFKNLLTHAVNDGELTQAQADKLLAALGSTSGSTGSDQRGATTAPSAGTSTTSA